MAIEKIIGRMNQFTPKAGWSKSTMVYEQFGNGVLGLITAGGVVTFMKYLSK